MNVKRTPRPVSSKSSKMSQVSLIPWDPDSVEHVKRLRQQRIACGWNQGLVESWRDLQRTGKIALHWVVLTEDDPKKEEKLEKHVKAFPREKGWLHDTASSFGDKPRDPSRKEFLPVGHISLSHEYENPDLVDGLYWIATFYISAALQGSGLGRAAMDSVEHMAISEPLNAKTLALNTVANEYSGKAEKARAMGRSKASVSNQDWYARRGYEVYKFVDEMWWETDKTGKKWPATAVFMRKDMK